MNALDHARPHPRFVVATVVIAMLTAACGATRESNETGVTREIAAARRQLNDQMAQCTQRYGYDPETAAKLAPHVLGEGEREWRACVYEAIEKYVIPRTLSPEVYRRAIAEDRNMTEAVANGTMTRAERQARVRQMLEEIDRTEVANRAKVQAQTLDRLETEMLQEMRQRSLSPLVR